ncbi:hypothetical protein JOF34_001436 [Microbacterium amylolyticum]|uniref:Uncharacterized protein n=1 Tax=Microbacterium amylolyticum TaxID=936337 RepID=A0ABS4ZHV3_9MICO|nr:hypothetical protein [Microbacterium amylolyticum]MBP2436850.1 hypothetical protein [Microbacterium amylolyticum]
MEDAGERIMTLLREGPELRDALGVVPLRIRGLFFRVGLEPHRRREMSIE